MPHFHRHVNAALFFGAFFAPFLFANLYYNVIIILFVDFLKSLSGHLIIQILISMNYYTNGA